MNITARSISLTDEKNIIINLIMHDRFIDFLHNTLSNNIVYFQASFSKIIAQWCLEFFEQFKQAPKFQIKDILSQHKDFLKSDEFESIEKFLVHLNDIYVDSEDKFNLRYEIKKTDNYFKLRKLQYINNRLSELIKDKNIIEAENIITSYDHVDAIENVAIDVLNDKLSASVALENKTLNRLFHLPGKAKDFFGWFNRNDFVAILSPAKRGKTWWFIELSFRALEMDCKVLLINFEMSNDELLGRSWSCFTGLPLEDIDSISLPYFENNIINYRDITKKALNMEYISQYMEDFKLHHFRSSYKLLCYPMYSKNVSDIKSVINNLEYIHNWIPDVVMIDYADILAPESGQKEYRHQIDATWKSLRSLAQERNICIITASQSNKLANMRNLQAGDVAEDSRKLAHVTKMFGLNQTSVEKKLGLMRIAMLEDRSRKFFPHEELVVLQNWEIGRTNLDCMLKSEIKNYDALIKEKEN